MVKYIRIDRSISMRYKVDNQEYEVIIEKKNNKNTYIRVKEDLKIYITTNYFVSNKYIEKLLNNNIDYLKKMLEKRKQQLEKEDNFYYLGNKYDIILLSSIDNVEIVNNKIYTRDNKMLEKWYKKQIQQIFKSRLDFNYERFLESIPYPVLKIRNMKTRWGVCNKKNKTVTLNSNLIKYDISKLDYVIIHELSHFIHFDHSRNFWNLVSKYCQEYKQIRKELRE